MDRILTKIFCIVFLVLKVLLIKICKIQSLDLLFLVVFISFYISRYHFFTQNYLKKIFVTNFPFLRDSLDPTPLPPTHPLNSRNPLSVRKVFFQCSLTYNGFSRLLCCDDPRKTKNSRSELISQFNFNPRVVFFI